MLKSVGTTVKLKFVPNCFLILLLCFVLVRTLFKPREFVVVFSFQDNLLKTWDNYSLNTQKKNLNYIEQCLNGSINEGAVMDQAVASEFSETSRIHCDKASLRFLS